jgi:GAF domain-containing protein
LSDGLTIVSDGTRDRRFRDNALVTGAPFIRFYAGAPLKSADGFNLGTLCAIDARPPRGLAIGQGSVEPRTCDDGRA